MDDFKLTLNAKKLNAAGNRAPLPRRHNKDEDVILLELKRACNEKTLYYSPNQVSGIIALNMEQFDGHRVICPDLGDLLILIQLHIIEEFEPAKSATAYQEQLAMI